MHDRRHFDFGTSSVLGILHWPINLLPYNTNPLQPTPTAHRDLKFENVLIASDGTLRLCDFGSASTHTGVIVDKRDRAEQEDAIMR